MLLPAQSRLVHEQRVRKQLVKELEQLKQMKVALLNSVGQQERTLKDLQVCPWRPVDRQHVTLLPRVSLISTFRGDLSPHACDHLPLHAWKERRCPPLLPLSLCCPGSASNFY